MIIPVHTIRQFADAMLALLPPGLAWRWPENGLGDCIFQALSAELVRVEIEVQDILDRAIELHRPAESLYTLAEYQRVADGAASVFSEQLPRQASRAGRMRAGQRLWSAAAEESSWPIKNVKMAHLLGPSIAGKMVAGRRLMGERSRYVFRVYYYATVVDPDVIAAALQEFKQAHMVLFFEDITGNAGNKYYA